jgi:hypothetical protein
MSFNSLYQNDASRIVDSGGHELDVQPDGSINVNASLTITEVEIKNDVGNPIPVSDAGGSLTVDGTVSTKPATLTPLGYEQVTVGTTAVGLTVPVGAKLALIQVDVRSVRWRDDGVNPTTSVGMRQAAGTQFEYSADLSAIKFIRAENANATLNVSYYS